LLDKERIMRKLVLAASLLLPACMHTRVDVGADGGGPTTPNAGDAAPNPSRGMVDANFTPTCRDTPVDGGDLTMPNTEDAAPGTGRAGDGGLTDTDPRFTCNESSCPASPPEFDSVCNVREWQSCAYRWSENGEGRYVGCTCFEKNSSVRMWDCRSAGGYGCPSQQPIPGTSCYSLGTSGCSYPPHVSCGCNLNDPGALWRCEDQGTVPGQATAGPASVPDGKKVKELTDAEAQTWCGWLLNINGPRANPPEGPVSGDGYATNLGYVTSPRFYGACMPNTFPISYCVANLKIAPCEATIAEMNDCALTVARDLPSPHGCGRFQERAHCEDTIFHPTLGTADASVSCGSLKVR